MDQIGWFEAAQIGDVAALERTLQDVNLRTHFGETALTFAAASGHEVAVLWLLEHGATVNVMDVFCAIRNGHNDCVTLMRERGTVSTEPSLVYCSKIGQ